MVLARLWEVMQTTTRDSVAQFLLLSSLVALSGRLVKMSHQHDDEKNALMEQLQAERDRHRGVLRRVPELARASGLGASGCARFTTELEKLDGQPLEVLSPPTPAAAAPPPPLPAAKAKQVVF
jgi:hypothetical protein